MDGDGVADTETDGVMERDGVADGGTYDGETEGDADIDGVEEGGT
jgi:hypothetical protein